MAEQLHEFSAKRILVIDRGDGLADDVRDQLKKHGANILGSMHSAGADIALIELGRVDAAILAANIEPEKAFLVAEALERQDIPFVFVVPPVPDGQKRRYCGYELGTPSSLQVIGRALFSSSNH